MSTEVLGRDGAADGEHLAARDAELEGIGDVVHVELLALQVRSISASSICTTSSSSFSRYSCACSAIESGIATGPTPSARRGSCTRTCGARRRCPRARARADRDVDGDALRRELILDLAERAVESARSRSSMLTTSMRRRPPPRASSPGRCRPRSPSRPRRRPARPRRPAAHSGPRPGTRGRPGSRGG